MKQISIFIVFILFLQRAFAQGNISIIPEPVKIVKNSGQFLLPSTITISSLENPELKTAITDLTERLTIPTGYHVSATNSGSATIKLNLN